MTETDVMRWLAEATGATMQYSADAGLSTYVSGGPGGGAPAQGGGAPGQAIPGSAMSATSAILWLVGGLGAISLGTASLARKGVRPEIGRFDALDALWNAATVGVMFGTFKLLAYRFHGHKISQAVLLLL